MAAAVTELTPGAQPGMPDVALADNNNTVRELNVQRVSTTNGNPMLVWSRWQTIDKHRIASLHALFVNHPVVRTITNMLTNRLLKNGIKMTEQSPVFSGAADILFKKFVGEQWCTFCAEYIKSYWCYGFCLWTWQPHNEFLGVPSVIDLTNGTVHFRRNAAGMTELLFERNRTEIGVVTQTTILEENKMVYQDVQDHPTHDGKLTSVMNSVENELHDESELNTYDMTAVAIRSNPTVFLMQKQDSVTDNLPAAGDMSVTMGLAGRTGAHPSTLPGGAAKDGDAVRDITGLGLIGAGQTTMQYPTYLSSMGQQAAAARLGQIGAHNKALQSKLDRATEVTASFVRLMSRYPNHGRQLFAQSMLGDASLHERLVPLKRDQEIAHQILAEEPGKYLERSNNIEERVYQAFGVPRMLVNRDAMSRNKKLEQGSVGEGSADKIYNDTVTAMARRLCSVLEKVYDVICGDTQAFRLAAGRAYTKDTDTNQLRRSASFSFPSIINQNAVGLMLNQGILDPLRYAQLMFALGNVSDEDMQFPAKMPPFTTEGFVLPDEVVPVEDPSGAKDTHQQATKIKVVESVKTGFGKSASGASGNGKQVTKTTERIVMDSRAEEAASGAGAGGGSSSSSNRAASGGNALRTQPTTVVNKQSSSKPAKKKRKVSNT